MKFGPHACAIGWFLAGVLQAAPVLVVHESGVDAYSEALQGVGSVLGKTYSLVDLQAPTGSRDLIAALNEKDLQLVIAVGSRALAEVQARHISAPVIGTMVLRGGEVDSAGHISLDIPLPTQLSIMRSLWPKRTRVGIIRNPSTSKYSSEVLEARARKEGFVPMVVDCDGPIHLLKAVSSLKGKVDFVICFPDPDLFNAVTIKPLVLASLEDRLPLIGFSPAFVRAGAAAGVYPDYRETGRQTAEMALRMLRGEESGPDTGPRKVQIAVNQRITRLLGLEFQTAGMAVEVFR